MISKEKVLAKRRVFDELAEGVAAMKGQRQGKITLHTFKVEPKALQEMHSKLDKETRKKLSSEEPLRFGGRHKAGKIR